MIPEGDDPPPPPLVDSRTPTPKRSYPFAAKENKRSRHYEQGHGHAQYMQHHQHHEMMQRQSHHQHHHRHHSTNAHTYYESSCETNEIVFGVVQEQEQDSLRKGMVIKAVDYGDPRLDHRNNIRLRINYTRYSNGY